jgi:sugar phosphate permease
MASIPLTPRARPHGNVRWLIGLLLGFGILINYFDRVNLSVAHPDLTKDFGLNDIQYGYLLSGFAWTYAALQIPGGVLLDRLGILWLGRIGPVLWSIACFWTAIANSFTHIFASRLLLGVAETPAFPVSSKATGYWFPKNERGLATSLFDAAAKFSNVIGVPIVAAIAFYWGWRMMFVFTAVLSLIYFALFVIFYQNPSVDKRLSPEERRYIQEGGGQPEGAPTTKGASLGYLLRNAKVWGLTIGFAAYGYSFYLFLTWLPSYLIKTQHWDVLKSGLYTAIPWGVATITDLVIGGWLVDYLIARGFEQTKVRKTLIVLGMILGLAIVGATTTKDPAIAIIYISVALGGLAFSAPIGWSIPALIAPKGSVGTVGSIMNFFNNVMGIAAPIVTGYIVGETQSFTNAFLTAAAVLLVGIFAYVVILGKIEPIPEPVES